MELVFLYVSTYKVFRNKSFHFDTRYHFAYDILDNFHRMVRLVSCDESALPRDFYCLPEFGPGTVDCVSAVIGENGTGKTTLAVLLQDIFEPAGDMREFVAIFADRKDDGSAEFSLYCHVPRDVNTRMHGLRFSGFVKMPDVNLWPDYTWPKYSDVDLRTKLRMIYYSPLFTVERVFGYRERVYDSEERFHEKRYSSISGMRRFGVRDLSVTGTTLNLIDDETFSSGSTSLLIYERKRVINFIREASIDPELNEALDIPVLQKGNALAFCLVDGELNETLHPTEMHLPGVDISDKLQVDGLDVAEYFDVTVTYQYLTSIVIKAFYLYANICFREWWLSPKSDKAFQSDIKWLVRVGKRVRARIQKNESTLRIESFLITSLEKYRGRDTRFESLSVFLSRLRELSKLVGDRNGNARWFFPLKMLEDDVYKKYIDLMSAYFEARRRKDICSFGFRWPLSSGEMSYVSMWARLFEEFKGMRDGAASHDSAILFMDEAETALHPKWQRQLVFRILTTWTKLMPESKHLQVIFGSHSPMLLSDIPKGNVVFLGAPDQVKEIEALPNTFGANVFDLFRTSFFLENGPVGEFARRKINSLLQKLATGKVTIKERSADAVLARLVGDTYIRNYLQSCIG